MDADIVPMPAPPPNPAFDFPDPLTFTYQTLGDVGYEVDVYLPASAPSGPIPACVYWHGGGLVMGNRGINTWAPKWLFDDALKAGIAIICPTYTFVSPHSGFDVLADIRACFRWLEASLNKELLKSTVTTIDIKRLAVAGSSAGGWMSYLSGLYATPRPKAIVSLYGMAGSLLTPFYLEVKTEPFFWLTPTLLSDSDFMKYFKTPSTERLTSTPLDSPRLDYYTWLLQKALFIDVLTDQSGLTAHLRSLPAADRVAGIPAPLRPMFPNLNVRKAFPPTFFIHGTADEAVPIEESRTMLQACEKAGVVGCRMLEVPGGNHDFDYEKESKDVEGLAEVVPWLLKQLG